MTKPLTKFVPTAALLLGLSAILIPVTARADSFKLSSYPGGNPAGNYTYGSPGTTIPAGPYQGQLTVGGTTHTLLVYCLDGDLTSYYGTTYSGTASTPNTPQEEEAAFLASYSLSKGAPSSSSSVVNNYEGPITLAIWQIMGTLGTGQHALPADPAAAPFITLAQNMYSQGKITQTFLSQVQVFTPSNTSTQRFITAVQQNFNVPPGGSAPEPGTVAMLGGGLALVVVGRLRRR